MQNETTATKNKKKLLFHHDFFLNRQRGMTGLETAVILICFVVVAAVFAYTMLSSGIYSSQKSSESVYRAIEEASSTIALKGEVIALDIDADGDVDQIIYTIYLALDGEPMNLTEPLDDDEDEMADDGSTHSMVISYMDKDTRINDLTWSKTIMGLTDGDNMLEKGEKAQITVDLTAAQGTVV